MFFILAEFGWPCCGVSIVEMLLSEVQTLDSIFEIVKIPISILWRKLKHWWLFSFSEFIKFAKIKVFFIARRVLGCLFTSWKYDLFYLLIWRNFWQLLIRCFNFWWYFGVIFCDVPKLKKWTENRLLCICVWW